MPLRPVDTDTLAEICRSIALDNYGFLYVDRVKDDLQSAYEGAEKKLWNAGTLSASDVKQALQEIASDEFSELERLRTGVYYYDPFGSGSGQGVANELTRLFRQQLVVTSETLRNRFDLAIDDVDFFAGELADRKLVRRIATGERDYFTIGPRLKEQTGEAGVDDMLTQRAVNGKISHDQLEKVVNVAATADVIRYLEGEGFVVDLDGEYLVESAIDDFGAHLADEVADAVEEEFESARYVLPEEELNSVLRTEVSARFDVLSRLGREMEDRVLAATRDALAGSLGLEDHRQVVTKQPEFDDYVAGEAARIKEEVEAGDGPPPARQSEYEEAAAESIEELAPGKTPGANRYIREAVEDAFGDLVAEEFKVE